MLNMTDEELDAFQLALGAGGMTPGVGNFADLADAGISLGRGDILGAVLAGLSAVPILGMAAGGANASRRAAKAAKAKFTPVELEVATATSRPAGAIGGKAVVPKRVVEELREGETVLNYGAGRTNKGGRIPHSDYITESGGKVTNYDFGTNVTPDVHDLTALDRTYDTVMASNVLNVQQSEGMLRRTLSEIRDSVNPSGKAIVNYPKSPRKSDITPLNLENILKEYFGVVDRISRSGKPPIFRLTSPKLTRSIR